MPKSTQRNATSSSSNDSPAERHDSIAHMAYYLAEKRGFEPGQELNDWFKAEQLLSR